VGVAGDAEVAVEHSGVALRLGPKQIQTIELVR